MNNLGPLKKSLSADETLIWAESPNPLYFLFQWGVAYGISFLVLWVGIGTSFAYGTDKYQNIGTIFCLGIAPFIFVSIFADSFKALFTIYGISNKRLIVLRDLPWKLELDSFYPPQIDAKKKTRRKNGSGDLVFAVIVEKGGKRTYEVEIGFLGLKDVEAVEKLIEDTFRSREP